ncbi:MAG TPA: trypsin-like peptidase domain-containing protein [Solirubrobacterales bacterium]|nr:trypsin-like peptidase domain-containing protein [Solirubrobacterales bacterium]
MSRLFDRAQRPAFALAIGLSSLLAATGVGHAASAAAVPAGPAGNVAQTFGLQGPTAPKAVKALRLTPSEKLGVTVGTPPEVRLPAVDRDALLRQDAMAKKLGGMNVKRLRYGVGRDLQVSVADGHWYDVAGGARLWVGEIVSTDALGLRLHFKGVHLPAGAELAIYSPGAAGVVKSGSALTDPERNVEFHEGSSAQPADFWTASFFGDRARLEYLAPAAAAGADGLPFAVDHLQHLYLDPVQQIARSLVKDAAGSCENDVTCHPEWADVARAVSGIGFAGAGQDAIYCSGQLLNSQAQDFTPYWLTANHCLDNQNDASSAEFFWFYQTSQCNGTPPSLSSVPHSLGATLVSTNPTSDYTLLMINGALPDNLYWAGWTSALLPNGIDAVAVHHPNGDFKRISFGTKEDNSACFDFQGTDGLQLVRVAWNDGVTEPGSSGSGIFKADTQQLFGQLFFGPSSCDASPSDRFDCYGAFSTTYQRIKGFLKAGSDDNSEPNDSCARARNVGKGTLKSRIVKVNDPDWFRINVPAHKTVTVTLNFSNGNGDIDLAAYAKCGTPPIATSTSTDDSETISLVNTSNKAAVLSWEVYLNSSTRNVYNQTVSIH